MYCNLITNTLLCTDYELFDMFWNEKYNLRQKNPAIFFLFEQIYKMIQKHWNCLNRTTRSAWLFLMKFQILLPPCSTRMSKVAKYPDSGFKHLKLLWSFRSTQFFLHQIANHNIDDFEPAFKKSKKEKLFFKIQIIVCMFSILWIQYVFLKRLIIKLPCICSVPER